MKYFALIDGENLVQSVMPVPLEALEEDYARKFGMTCIETKKDGSIRNRFAGKGCLYDSQNDAFVGRKPYESWVFDASAGDWTAPVAKPADADDYVWDEELTQWRRQVEISSEISEILSSGLPAFCGCNSGDCAMVRDCLITWAALSGEPTVRSSRDFVAWTLDAEARASASALAMSESYTASSKGVFGLLLLTRCAVRC